MKSISAIITILFVEHKDIDFSKLENIFKRVHTYESMIGAVLRVLNWLFFVQWLKQILELFDEMNSIPVGRVDTVSSVPDDTVDMVGGGSIGIRSLSNKNTQSNNNQ